MSLPVPINHSDLGVSRVGLQYSESANFLATIRSSVAISDELDILFPIIADQIAIDIAEGVNLDVIGQIVGVSRIISNSVFLTFFGFLDNVNALNFGEEGNLSIGGRFYNEDEPFLASTVLPDLEYRLLIRAKITKNASNGTGQEIIDGLIFLFTVGGVTPSIVMEDGIVSMTIKIAIGRTLTIVEKALITGIDILPRPMGVLISERVSFVSGDYFGFEGQVGAQPFGEEGSLTIGGSFAEEF